MDYHLFPRFKIEKLLSKDSTHFIDKLEGSFFKIGIEELRVLFLFNGLRSYREIANSFSRYYNMKICNNIISEISRKFSKYIQENENPENSLTFPSIALPMTEKKKNTFPIEVIFFLTEACNFECNYCIRDGVKKANLGNQVIKKSIGELVENDCLKVTLTGGEPFLDKSILSYVKILLENEIYPQITTNGSLLNKKTLCKLAGYGLPLLQVSLDTINIKTFKTMTGLDCVNTVKQNIVDAINLGIKVVVKCVITLDNYKEINELVNFCENAGVYRVDLTPIQFTERDCEEKRALSVSTEGLEQLKKQIINNTLHKSVRFYSPNRTWLQQDHINPCGGYSHSLIVQANGDIGFCGNMPNQTYGNVYKTSLKSAWNSNEKCSMVEKFVNPSRKSSCGECQHYSECLSGCPLLKIEKGHSIANKDPRCFIWDKTQNRRYL